MTSNQAQGLLIQQHVTNPSSDTSKKITGKSRNFGIKVSKVTACFNEKIVFMHPFLEYVYITT